MRFHRFYIALMLSVLVGCLSQKLSVSAEHRKCTINNSWEQDQLLYSPLAVSTPPPLPTPEQREGNPVNALNEVEPNLRQVIQSNPNDAENYLKLISFLSDRKQYDQVVLVAQQWIQAISNSGRLPYRILGDAFLEQNQIDQAITAYSKAPLVQLSEREKNSWYDYLTPSNFYARVGDLFLLQGKKTEAIAAYTLGAQKQVVATIVLGSIFDKGNHEDKYLRNLNVQQAERLFRICG